MSGAQGRGRGRQPCGTEPAGVAQPGNRLCQLSPRGTRPWSRARAELRCCSQPNLSPGESQASPLCCCKACSHWGLSPFWLAPCCLGSLLMTPLPPKVPLCFAEGRSCPPALRTMRGACAQAAEGGSRVGCGGGAWGGATTTLLGEQSLAAADSGLPPCPQAGSQHIHPQSQLSRSWGACHSPGPRTGPSSCSTAAHRLAAS